VPGALPGIGIVPETLVLIPRVFAVVWFATTTAGMIYDGLLLVGIPSGILGSLQDEPETKFHNYKREKKIRPAEE
jgi:hypothetical protein